MISPHCTGAVLAGGTSSRFDGVLKGLEPLGGRRVIDRVLRALSEVADELLVIANDGRIRDALTGLTVRGDVRAERGSLIGVHSALAYATDGALVVGWDMPFLSAALLGELRRIGERAGAAVFPEGPRGPEPLCGYYPRSCIDLVEARIAAGDLRLGALVRALPGAVIVPLAEVARFGSPERLFTNINTPGDLETAARWLEQDQRSAGARLPQNQR